MELRVLNYFLMAAREENITKAASLLHVTQPTLSRQLMQLEEELGVKLFLRSSHNIILTEDGMLLKRRAQELVSLADKTLSEFKRAETELTGEIAIGGGELKSVDSLAKLLSAFKNEHPLVRYALYTGNADHIKDRIEMGLIDVGLLFEPVDVSKYEYVRMPQQEEWGVLVREDSPLAAKEALMAEDLRFEPIILSARTVVQGEIANWFGSLFVELNIVMTHNLPYNAAIMVRNGMGVAFTLRLDYTFEGLKFIPLSPSLRNGSLLVWKKNQILSPATAAFIEFSKKCVRGISSNKI